MGILRTFEKIGDGMFGLFFKFMFFLIAIVLILMVVIGMVTYWKFLVGFLIGALFSPYLYSYLEENLQLGLPEFFFWNYNDVAEAFFVDESQVNETYADLQEKARAAQAELTKLNQKCKNITTALQDIKAKKDIKEIIVGKDTKYDSSRLRKAILMSIGDPEWVSEMKEIKMDVDWSKFI